MKPTPGPWTADTHGGAFYIFGPDMAMVADGAPDEIGIARMRGVGRGASDEEQQANTILIATSPELLDELKGEHFRRVKHSADNFYEDCRACQLIAKADGRL